MNQNASLKQKTAAAVIIGDEILTGKVKDENTFVLSQLLFERGVCLNKVEVIPDVVDEIASVVRRLSNSFDYVFTSGGIGPTHDDKTYESVAKAFNLPLEFRESIVEEIAAFYNKSLNDIKINKAMQKMLVLPQPCEIVPTHVLWLPLVVVKNVYVFPGVPRLFADLLHAVKDRFCGQAKERVLVYTKKSESEIAGVLEEIQTKYPEVAIGSYPKYKHDSYNVMISLESFDAELIKEAVNKVEAAITGFREL